MCSGAPTASTAIFYSKVLLLISLQSPPPTHTDDALLLTRLLLTATEAAEVEEAVKHQHWLFMQHGQSRMASLCTAPKNSPHNSFTRFDEINQMQSERESADAKELPKLNNCVQQLNLLVAVVAVVVFHSLPH